ncbi:MAG: hypothetical protein IT376_17115 [Polyangiaceae bacterium]|nr:hypothetical protein [Polyangiaceae bacterium]
MAVQDDRKLFVAGLPDSITDEVLRSLFEATGAVVESVSLPRDKSSGRLRGFAFVTLGDATQAEEARQSLDGSIQSGHSISVRRFQQEPPRREPGGAPRDRAGPRGDDRGGDRTLYVGNLPYDAGPTELTALLAELGAPAPARVHLPMTPEGRPRGFGFVTMPSAEAAQEALAQLGGAALGGRRLMVNIAHPRGERPAPSGFGPPADAPAPFDRAPRRDWGPPPAGAPPSDAAPPPEEDDRGGRTGAPGKKKKRTSEGARRGRGARDDDWRRRGSDWDDD